MPIDQPPNGAVPRGDRDPLLAWIEAGEARARRKAATAAAELGIGEEERLDDRTRMALRAVQIATAEALVADVGRHAARLLASRGETALASQLEGGISAAAERLMRAGLPADVALVEELLTQTRLALLEEDLPPRAGGEGVPSLLVRLSSVQDRSVASAASALMVAESSRLDAAAAQLPAELHHRLVWLAAAALREEVRRAPAADRAIGEAAQRSLSAADEGERVEALAMRLALAIDARPDELDALFEEALGDRRLALLSAVLAHAAGLEFEQARALIVDRDAGPLGLMLRALDLPRQAIARVLLALAEADPQRSSETLPEQVDALVARAPEEAWQALAPLRLGRDYRAAIRQLREHAA